MSTHKHIDRICAAAMVLALAITVLFVNGQALGIQPASRVMGYENRLFDTSRVHSIDIVMDGWEDFIQGCEDEEYAGCALVIDGEAVRNAAIRAKGNTSLSMVSQMDSSRYSFKIEFDHYSEGSTYHGLDKLCLNNLIQDNTCMKDYLTYRMMAEFSVASPLCSFVFVTVNGQDWGLYLAVEAVEESFLQRNFGRDYGELYKPDSMDFGGGRGNGRGFRMDGFPEDGEKMDAGGPDRGNMGFSPPGTPEDGFPPDLPEGGFSSGPAGSPPDAPEGWVSSGMPEKGGGPGGGPSSGDVKLQYTDNNPESYANIFDNVKTPVTEADQARLIDTLRRLGTGEDIPGTVDVDAALRYFVVHNYVVNGDSYTGSMVHNYYLYEKDGRISMIPWDYNLAFGGFQGDDASAAVNDPIDTPLSVTGSGDRPMADWIFQSPEYTELYHRYFQEFLETVDPAAIIEEAYRLIDPYVQKDPSAFCTYEEFETGAAALAQFCALRSESIAGQLVGSIPTTREGQAEDGSALTDISGLELSDMGGMEQGGFFDRGDPGEGSPGGGPRAERRGE